MRQNVLMDEASAAEVVQIARSDPVEAMRMGRAALARDLAPAARSVVLRAMCEASRWAGTVDESLAYGAEAVALALDVERPDLWREAVLTQSGSLHLAGRVDDALVALGRISGGAPPAMLAKIEFQRSVILAREGRTVEALSGFAAALPFFERAGDDRFTALCHQNSGNIHLERGDVPAAIVDFEEARRRFDRIGLLTPTAAMEHNLGRALGYSGRMPEAWAHLERAERSFEVLTGGSWEVRASKCELLIQAGLYSAAAALARQASEELSRSGHELERAEADLWEAIARLSLGDADAAVTCAARAAGAFERQGRRVWSLQAQAVELRCRASADPDADVTELGVLARALGDEGCVLAAAAAWQVVAVHRPDDAAVGLRCLSDGLERLPVELEIAIIEVDARRHWTEGNRSAALAATRRALGLGERYRAALGATDLIVGVGARLERVVRLGLELRLAIGRPWSILTWIDRARAGSAAHSLHERSPGESELVAELRSLHVMARVARPEEQIAVRSRQRTVQRRLAQLDRSTRGGEAVARPIGRSFEDVRRGRTILQYFVMGDQLHAVIADSTGGHIVPCAEVERVSIARRRLAAAIAGLLAREDDRAAARVQDLAGELDELIVPPISGTLVRIAPPADMMSVPWNLLPNLRDRAVDISPLVGADDGDPPTVCRTAIVEGPSLVSSEAEIEMLAELYPTAEILAGHDATVDNVLRAIRTVDILHVAGHGSRSDGDGRFAQIELADGAVTPFEIEALERTPALVTFSACHAGFLEPQPGDATVGVTRALFGGGTSAVVAPVCELPDSDSTVGTFVRFHEVLRECRRAEQALVRVRRAAASQVEAVVAGLVSCSRPGRTGTSR